MAVQSNAAANPSAAPAPPPSIIVRAGNPAVPFVLSVLVAGGAFWAGMSYQRAKSVDYSVRVSGMPEKVQMTGAPDRVLVTGEVSGIPKEIAFKGAEISGIPNEIALKGGEITGIPREITFKGTSLDGILPKEINVHTGAVAGISLGDGMQTVFVAVTPIGEVWAVTFIGGTSFGTRIR